MKSRWLLPVSSLLFLFVPLAPSNSSESEDTKEGVIAEIRAVLSTQQEAWNHGDIDGFMNGYERAETTVFVSGDELTRGWQTVRNRYYKKYGDCAKMGTLIFSDLEIEPLGPDSAVALGRWDLKRANDNPHGRFTLVFRHTPDGWRIVHDHTSAASPTD
jgi:ketosteroid isomerase-like protein